MPRMRALHIDVRGERSAVEENLHTLTQQFDNLQTGRTVIPEGPSTLSIRRSVDRVRAMKMAEMMGTPTSTFTIAEFVTGYEGRISVLVLQNILPMLRQIGIDGEVTSKGGRLVIQSFDEVVFDESGTILQSDNPAVKGKDIFHYISCFIGQDLAIILKKDGNFPYVADISSFEKTPKNAEGRNSYLGRDIIDFHSKAPNFGRILGKLFQELLKCFSLGTLDMLTVDLNGQNRFIEPGGTQEVSRFERDYFLPLHDETGEFIGMIGFADVFFKRTGQKESPFEGGSYIQEVHSQVDLLHAKLTEVSGVGRLEQLMQRLAKTDLSTEERNAILKSILAEKELFFDEILKRAEEENRRRFGEKLEVYGISYIADTCANDCVYCGLRAGSLKSRSSLSDKEMEADFRAVLRHHPDEFCVLAGESPHNKADCIRALRILGEVNQTEGFPLTGITFNVAPMDTEDFHEIVDANQTGLPLQFRIFQEIYDPGQYREYHLCGPKTDFDFRIKAQERALQAGFDRVGIGTLLGLNRCNVPYQHAGNDAEIMALIQHANRLKDAYGGFPYSLSIPRHQPVQGDVFRTPNPVDDKTYVFYHALLRLALPDTKLIITAREKPELINELESLVNIRDLAPRPGVGGNIRPTVNFQNELGDSRSAEEILSDLTARGKR